MSEMTCTEADGTPRSTACVAAWGGQDTSPVVCGAPRDGVLAEKVAARGVARDALVASDALDWRELPRTQDYGWESDVADHLPDR